ncbi:hypothetical protein K474DRAFT_1648389 [Panus rudis PR-1116 ss-1]|nr:hypothetical protein K474DRAFT_1648389 [Panus rudis PR-1116 ss-1]
MHVRHAQRKHLIHQLNSLLLVLHTVSYLQSPSTLVYFTRITSQYQFSRPRKSNPYMSLRIWFFLIIFFNSGSVWSHASVGAASGRSIILDFVGMAYRPSKLHLLFLDFLIIALELVLTTIAYEAAVATEQSPDTPDPLLPIPPEPPSTPLSRYLDDINKPEESPYALDLRFSTIIHRLRNPAPAPSTQVDDVLPLPNTSTLPGTLRMILERRARLQRRRAQEAGGTERTDENSGNSATETAATPGRIPGGLDIHNET